MKDSSSDSKQHRWRNSPPQVSPSLSSTPLGAMSAFHGEATSFGNPRPLQEELPRFNRQRKCRFPKLCCHHSSLSLESVSGQGTLGPLRNPSRKTAGRPVTLYGTAPHLMSKSSTTTRRASTKASAKSICCTLQGCTGTSLRLQLGSVGSSGLGGHQRIAGIAPAGRRQGGDCTELWVAVPMTWECCCALLSDDGEHILDELVASHAL